MRRANKKYCSVVHNTCICIQTLRREQSQRLRDTEICSSIIPCMRKIRHFCLTLNYPLSNVSSRAVFVFMGLVTYNKHKFKLSPVMFNEYACVLGLTYMSSKMFEPAIRCIFLGISMQSQIPMKMTQCLKNEYGEGCSLDRKQKTSKKEKLSKEKWFISLFRSQRFCEKIF